MNTLDRIHIEGFKSIRSADLILRPINVLIGANGAGKSNFLGVFKLLHQIADSNLRNFIAKTGGADAVLHKYSVARENTLYIRACFADYGYLARLAPAANDSLVFTDERADDEHAPEKDFVFRTPLDGLDSGISRETLLNDNLSGYRGALVRNVLNDFRRLVVYHFFDTGDTSRLKVTVNINDNALLRSDGANLAALLYLFQNNFPDSYRRIVETIRLAIPFFKDFELQPNPHNQATIILMWRQEDSDVALNADSLSDGMLRFICLVTLFMQPTPPPVIIIDEPELGLHPYAETLLASMVKSVAARGHQIIISTQSSRLVDNFEPEDIIVVEREHSQTVFKLQSTQGLEEWLAEYSLGELWVKNVIGGRP